MYVCVLTERPAWSCVEWWSWYQYICQ